MSCILTLVVGVVGDGRECALTAGYGVLLCVSVLDNAVDALGHQVHLGLGRGRGSGGGGA